MNGCNGACLSFALWGLGHIFCGIRCVELGESLLEQLFLCLLYSSDAHSFVFFTYQKTVEEVVKTESVEPTPEAPAEAPVEDTPEAEETPKEEEEAETPKENVESTAEEADDAIADTNAQKEAFSCCGIAVQ
jgi:outer membrane biosynthesis protein TonB